LMPPTTRPHFQIVPREKRPSIVEGATPTKAGDSVYQRLHGKRRGHSVVLRHASKGCRKAAKRAGQLDACRGSISAKMVSDVNWLVFSRLAFGGQPAGQPGKGVRLCPERRSQDASFAWFLGALFLFQLCEGASSPPTPPRLQGLWARARARLRLALASPRLALGVAWSSPQR
jgi:hypothetical protein